MKKDRRKEKGWDETVVNIFNAYNRISKSINTPQLTKVDLTSSQIKVLITFSDMESFTMTELSNEHSVSVSAMTSMVDRLIQSGLLKRDKDDTDRRIVRVCLTDKGKKMVGHLMNARKQALEEFMIQLNDSEIKLFLESIESVAHFLSRTKQDILNK